MLDWSEMDDAGQAQKMADTGTQLYEELMRFRPEGLSPNAWAVQAGVSRTIWQDLRRHGNPSRRTLEKLLATAGSSLAEFEALRVGRTSPALHDVAGIVGEDRSDFRAAELPPLPLVWSQCAEDWEPGISQIEVDKATVQDRLPRPISLADDPGAYALIVPDDSMWPRFRRGRPIVVSPTAPIEPGDDVLVIVTGGGAIRSRALIKELAGLSARSLQLRQFTPDRIFEVLPGKARSVHKVVGELI